MESFEYTSNPARVVFGSGCIQKLPQELSSLNISKPVILISESKSQSKTASKIFVDILQSKGVGIFSGARLHTPIETTEEALKYVKKYEPDGIISLGGGSVIGLGKAISVREGLKHVCIPTTYAGSEMTAILGETTTSESGEKLKTTRKDPAIRPEVVFYDVDLTMSLPKRLSATSGMNAMAHAIEALYAQDRNPVTTLLALEGIQALARSLPELMKDLNSTPARTKALYGAWLCSSCAGSVSMGLHHKICHTVGGSFDLPHSDVHTIMLPYTFAYNSRALSQDDSKRLADVLPDSEGDTVRGLNLLYKKLDIRDGLKDLGMKEQDVDKAAELATKSPYANPREVTEAGIKKVIQRAWAGEEAVADL